MDEHSDQGLLVQSRSGCEVPEIGVQGLIAGDANEADQVSRAGLQDAEVGELLSSAFCHRSGSGIGSEQAARSWLIASAEGLRSRTSSKPSGTAGVGGCWRKGRKTT